MPNLYRSLLSLLPSAPLQVGTVLTVDNGVATLSLPGGGTAQARGNAVAGGQVYFRDGLIEGPAPALPVVVIEV